MTNEELNKYLNDHETFNTISKKMRDTIKASGLQPTDENLVHILFHLIAQACTFGFDDHQIDVIVRSAIATHNSPGMLIKRTQ